MKKACICIVSFFFCGLTSLSAQNISTEGTDFWFSFMENAATFSAVELEVYISANDSTNGVISVPKSGWSQNFIVEEGVATKIVVPLTIGMALGSGVNEGKGIHVETDRKVSVFALNKRSRSADASVIFPTNSLGKEYYAHAYHKTNGSNNNRPSQVMVVGVIDNTTIEITPTANTIDGKVAGQSFEVSLNAGEIYQFKANGDLTGTKARTVNSDGTDCKNFAFFSGNEWTEVGTNCGSALDHLFEQMPPVNTWGQNFTLVPLRDRTGGDIYRIIGSQDNTNVTVGSVNVNLNEGQFQEFLIADPTAVSSNQQISISQFSRSAGCDGRNGDPFMILVSPDEQMLKRVTFNALPVQVITNFYLNIVTETASISDFRLDGGFQTSSFQTVPGNSALSYAQFEISVGNHTIESTNTGFIGYVYGFGDIESFGYGTGMSLNNLNVEIFSQDQTLSILAGDTVCVGTQVKFEARADTTFTVFNWTFDADIDTGRNVIYTFDEPGDIFVRCEASTGIGDCANSESGSKVVYVVEPTAEIVGPQSVCPDASGISYEMISENAVWQQWFVDGGVFATSPFNPEFTVNWGPTNSDALIQLATRNQLGCYGDTIQHPVKINFALDPAAPLGEDTLCFDDVSNIAYEAIFANGNGYEWFIDGGQIVSSNNENVVVNWDGPGTGKLWFEETSLSDTICSGVSDELTVVVLPSVSQSGSLVTDVSCFGGSNGIVTVQVAGGLQPYDYSWSTGSNAATLVGVGAGTYNLTVTDGFECESSAQFVVNQPATPLSSNLSGEDVLCFGENTGALQAAASGGTAPYSYSWTEFPNLAESDINNVPAGTYSLIVRDFNMCEDRKSLTIAEPALLEGSIASFNTLCPGEPTGRSVASVTGGVGPYDYLWDADPSNNDSVIEGLFSGNYQLQVDDANGCSIGLNTSLGEDEPRIYIPEAFTPNSDLLNDSFVTVLSCSGLVDLKIYNRWGEMIFAQKEENPTWDGTYEGEYVQNGAYVYTVKYTGNFLGVEYVKERSGTLKVLR